MHFCLQVFGSRVRVDSMAKIAELEAAEKEKMKVKFASIFFMHIPKFTINNLYI